MSERKAQVERSKIVHETVKESLVSGWFGDGSPVRGEVLMGSKGLRPGPPTPVAGPSRAFSALSDSRPLPPPVHHYRGWTDVPGEGP